MVKGHQSQLLTGVSSVSEGLASAALDVSLPRRRREGPLPSVGRRFLSYQDLLDRGIRFSRVHLRRMERTGTFPMRVVLGAGSAVQTSIAWVADEVIAWENARIAARDAAPGFVKLKIASASEGA
jgi:predicted DNA-binding transcriptional regulator AlpA